MSESEWDISGFITSGAPRPGPPPSQKPWLPDLNPTQRLIWDDPSQNILADGEKGSGKSIGCLHKLVRHLYEGNEALAFVIVTSYNVGDMGAWHDLQNLVLPAWRDGNREPESMVLADGRVVANPKAGELMDSGIGLEYTDSKMDPKTKASKIYVRNMHGTWSLVVLLSIPYSAVIQERIKGPAPSFVYVEELTNCDSRDYHKYLSAQLGRRRRMGTTPQQFLASANPEGPSHWVYKLFFVDAADPNGKACPDGIRRKPTFSRYHVPVSENMHRLPPGYVDRLRDSFGDDEVDAARLIEGIWVDRPSGEAIFKDDFSPAIHVRGDARRSIGLLPRAGFPVVCSYDPGPVNFSVHLMQALNTTKGVIWVVFDEVNLVNKSLPYFLVVPMIMRRRLYWQELLQQRLAFEDVSDAAAFSTLRPDGTFDNREIERLSEQWCKEHPGEPDKPHTVVQPIKLRPCPKGNDSVPARTRTVKALLKQERILVSALCNKTIAMFNGLESESVREGKYDDLAAFRPKRSAHLHPFDSLSYGIFFYESAGGTFRRPSDSQHRVYECGSG